MATFNFTGAISGLDTSSILSALIAAERAPLTRLQAQRTAFKASQTSYGDLRSLLAKLENAAKAFSRDLAGSRRSAASSNATVLTAVAGTTALAGTYAMTVDRLATSTRATSSAAMGTAITDADLDRNLADLALPGTVTAGSVGMMVDGKVVRATIGAPASTTLRQALTAISGALTTQVRANEGGGSTASVTASIVNNRVQLALSDTASTHSVYFGVGGDTSNALGVLGLSGTGNVSLATATPMTGRTALGVTRTSSALDAAGLTGLAAASTGTLTINGTAITYATATDSLNTIVSRINASSAGVVASLDRTNDKLVLTAKSGGAGPIAIEDTGTLAAALKIPPGSTQQLGQQAQVTIDGQAYLSDTNKVTTALGGVTITLLSQGTSTLTVTPDEAGMTTAVTDLVNAYNTLADKLDTLTANDPKGTRGALAGEGDVRSLALSLRRSMTTSIPAAGVFKSLSEIGVTTGVPGAAVGTTDRLALNAEKLKQALEQDPNAVASLLNGDTGVFAPLASALATWTKAGGRIDGSLESLASQLRGLDEREKSVQVRIDLKQAALERRFAAMERALAEMQTTSRSLSSTVGSLDSSG